MTNLGISSAELAQALPGIPGQAQDLTEAFGILTHHVQSELGDIAQTTFFISDGLQRAVSDAIFDLFRPQSWSPNNLLRTGSEAIQQTVRLVRLLAPGQAALAWQELRNKVEVFALVKNLSSILGLPAHQLLAL